MISKNKLKYFSSLRLKKNRQETGFFLVEGLRLCEELFASKYPVEKVFYSSPFLEASRGEKLIAQFRGAHVSVENIPQKSLKSLTDTVQPQGIVAVVKKKAFDIEKLKKKQKGNLVAVDRINNPGNLGTIIRTACWFHVSGLLLSSHTVDYTNPKVVRASMGAVFHLPVFDQLDLSKTLFDFQTIGYRLYVTEISGSRVYTQANFSKKNILVLGNEAGGVNNCVKLSAASRITIPKVGTGESLNVAVAAGIVLAEMALKKIKHKG
ncbi:MAG: TrmH family RNA methyltransferase [bacterium]